MAPQPRLLDLLRTMRSLLANVGDNCALGSLRSPQRALPTETKLESGTSRSKSGTSVKLSNNGLSLIESNPAMLVRWGLLDIAHVT